MGQYCCCGVKKRETGWVCECNWDEWFLCFAVEGIPINIPIKRSPDSEGTYTVRIFEDGDHFEDESEFSLIPKNWGEATNDAISSWKIEYSDGWMGCRGVYAWKSKSPVEQSKEKE